MENYKSQGKAVEVTVKIARRKTLKTFVWIFRPRIRALDTQLYLCTSIKGVFFNKIISFLGEFLSKKDGYLKVYRNLKI